MVPHGVPALPLCDRKAAAAALGLPGRFVLLAGGLLSPAKGIEDAIRAMPAAAAAVPGAVLVVAGQPHPSLAPGYVVRLARLAAQARPLTLLLPDGPGGSRFQALL